MLAKSTQSIIRFLYRNIIKSAVDGKIGGFSEKTQPQMHADERRWEREPDQGGTLEGVWIVVFFTDLPICVHLRASAALYFFSPLQTNAD